MTQKKLLSLLIASFFLISMASAFDSGWTNFRDNSDYVVCGGNYQSCSNSLLGVDWFQERQSSRTYGLICGEAGTDCNIGENAAIGQDFAIPTEGEYFLMLKITFGLSSNSDDETLAAGISTSRSTSWQKVTDLGTGEKSCILRNSYNLDSGNKNIRAMGIEGSVHPTQFRLTDCIPNESIVYCNDGTQAVPTCEGPITPPISDPIAPVVQITSPENQTYNTTNIIVDANASQSIDAWSYSVDGSEQYVLVPGLAYQFQDNSCYSLTVYGENANGVGNDSVEFCVNTTTPEPVDPKPAPIVTIVSPIDNTVYNTTLIPINATSNQTITTWRIQANNGNANPSQIPTTQIFSEGCWTLVVYGENANGVGNNTVSFCVNLTQIIPPVIPPVNDTNQTNETTDDDRSCTGSCGSNNDNDEDINPYNFGHTLLDNILNRNRDPIVLGVNDEDSNSNIYPILILLLLLGIIITLVLIFLLGENKKPQKENKLENFY